MELTQEEKDLILTLISNVSFKAGQSQAMIICEELVKKLSSPDNKGILESNT